MNYPIIMTINMEIYFFTIFPIFSIYLYIGKTNIFCLNIDNLKEKIR